MHRVYSNIALSFQAFCSFPLHDLIPKLLPDLLRRQRLDESPADESPPRLVLIALLVLLAAAVLLLLLVLFLVVALYFLRGEVVVVVVVVVVILILSIDIDIRLPKNLILRPRLASRNLPRQRHHARDRQVRQVVDPVPARVVVQLELELPRVRRVLPVVGLLALVLAFVPLGAVDAVVLGGSRRAARRGAEVVVDVRQVGEVLPVAEEGEGLRGVGGAGGARIWRAGRGR